MDIRINADLTAEQLLPLYRQAWWAKDRDADGVSRMLKHTPLHVTVWNGEHLVGFARSLTDGVYRALVDDVIVDESVRGQGVGKQLVNALTAELADVGYVFLGCDDKVRPFYESLGWRTNDSPGMSWKPNG